MRSYLRGNKWYSDLGHVDAKGVAKPQPKEEWKDAFYYETALPGKRVSSRGRAQMKHPGGKGWGHKFTPKHTEGVAYATIGDKVH